MAKPRIAVNARLLLPGRLEGIGRFAWELLSRLVAQHPEVDFGFFFDRPFAPEMLPGPNVRGFAIPPQARHPLLWHTWFHLTMKTRMAAWRPQLFFSPEFYLCGQMNIPQVNTIHDLAYEHFPKDIPPFASWHCRTFSPRYAHSAARILTVSEYTRQDICRLYGISPDKIVVACNGAGEHFHPLQADAQQAVRDRYTGGAPYFHFVGAMQPRKNLETLFAAFDLFKSTTDAPHRLLIAGRRAWHYDAALRAWQAMTHREAVVFTGYVPDADLAGINAASAALCYVPYFEGFGIPILEAMRSGAPVICSNVSAMPEVAGDAALLVPPRDITALAAAMEKLWREPALAQSLVVRGFERQALFSWQRATDVCWQTLSPFL